MTHVFMNAAPSHGSPLPLSFTGPPPPSASLGSEAGCSFWDSAVNLQRRMGGADGVQTARDVCLRNFSGIIMTNGEFIDLAHSLIYCKIWAERGALHAN